MATVERLESSKESSPLFSQISDLETPLTRAESAIAALVAIGETAPIDRRYERALELLIEDAAEGLYELRVQFRTLHKAAGGRDDESPAGEA